MTRPHRILILTPWVPYPATGACQQDRWNGFLQLQHLGYDIHVIAKIHHFQDRTVILSAFRDKKIPLTLVEHPRHLWTLFLQKIPSILRTPALLDGAALEYTDPAYERVVIDAVDSFKPDVLWMEYTTHWPLLRLLKKYGIPTIMKSSLNEPQNCIDEHGGSLLSRLKALPKYPGERIAARESSMILAITPDEEQYYRSLGAKKTMVLPLRGLSTCFTQKIHSDKKLLDVVFLSSNYNMGHNRDALAFLVHHIIPLVRRELPGVFRFHLTGKKFPNTERSFLATDVIHEGFIDDLGAFLGSMDIALCPWITGQGMQQKVFEPLCRSLPLLTTKVAGYPFGQGKDIILCKSSEDYLEGLRLLMDATQRNRLSASAYQKAVSLFSSEAVESIMHVAIDSVLEAKERISRRNTLQSP